MKIGLSLKRDRPHTDTKVTETTERHSRKCSDFLSSEQVEKDNVTASVAGGAAGPHSALGTS